jgi:cellulose synthase/poly-beta-1,6-N-acetylglucosamine synthase-like glycosyltransferase
MAAHLITLFILGAYLFFSVFWLLGRWRTAIVIPFRNEVPRIKPLLEIITHKIRLPQGSEVIFVNDHSEDETEKWLTSYPIGHTQCRIFHLPKTETGKKAALSLGVSKASHSFIVTLDADTLPTQEGMDTMARYSADEEVRMVCGMVVQKSHGWPGAPFADLEFLSLSGSGAAFAGLGFPFLCNGAFLGFRKEAFREVGGYSGNMEYPGGDDVFLLEKIRTTYGKKAIRYLTRFSETAETPGDESPSDFFQRRIRWGSKSAGYGLHGKMLTALMICIHVSWFGIFVFHLASANLAHVLVVAGVKLTADLAMLGSLCIRYRRMELISCIIPAAILHPLYLAFAAFASLKGTFAWKGRKYGNQPGLG